MSLIGSLSKKEAIEKFGRYVSSGKADFFTKAGLDFIPGRREGIYIYDMDEKMKLINCHCNGGVFNLGHRNPEIVDTLKEALGELDIGNHHFMSEQKAILGERLAGICPGDVNRVVFAAGGGEAIDIAIKLARGYTKRAEIVSAIGGFHGHTGFALPAGDELYSKPFEPLVPGYKKVKFGDVSQLEQAVNENTAAVLFETIPATLGMAIPPEDYFKEVRRITKEKGAVMICDEVQTGLGRCGAYWAIDTYGVVPDMIVTGKGLSGGIYPMSAVVYSDELDGFFHENPFIHISTFGGSEVGCRVALKVVEILERPEFLEHVRSMASLFEKGLLELKAKYPELLVEVRQKGLMIGLKMATEWCGPMLTLAGFQNGILTIYANNDTSISQILPPLIIKKEEALEVIERLDSMLSWVEKNLEQS
ncbi:MAG: aspartate aminotransferase family protein [Actinomycetota bacterium]|nr:aspartate aminotransferase family protein [Actinomycetota bacterium]